MRQHKWIIFISETCTRIKNIKFHTFSQLGENMISTQEYVFHLTPLICAEENKFPLKLNLNMYFSLNQQHLQWQQLHTKEAWMCWERGQLIPLLCKKVMSVCGCKETCKITHGACNTIRQATFSETSASLIISAWHELQLKCSLWAQANRLRRWQTLVSLGKLKGPRRDVTHWYEWAPAICEHTGCLI